MGNGGKKGNALIAQEPQAVLKKTHTTPPLQWNVRFGTRFRPADKLC